VGGDAALADQVTQLRLQRRRQTRHQAGQGQAEPAPLRSAGAVDLTPAGEQHRRGTPIEALLELLEPAALQRSQQRRRLRPIQHLRQPGHRQLQPQAAGLLQQHLQLGIGQGHVGAHQHQPRPGEARGIAAPQTGQAGGIEGLRGQGHQAIEQAGGRLEQQPPGRRRRRIGHGPHGDPEGRQLLGPLGIDRQHHLIAAGAEALTQGGRVRSGCIQLRQADRLHRQGRNPAAALVLDPGG